MALGYIGVCGVVGSAHIKRARGVEGIKQLANKLIYFLVLVSVFSSSCRESTTISKEPVSYFPPHKDYSLIYLMDMVDLLMAAIILCFLVGK